MTLEGKLDRMSAAVLALVCFGTAPALHAQQRAGATATLHVPPVAVINSISAPAEQGRDAGYVELTATVTVSANTEYTVAVGGLPEGAAPKAVEQVLVRDVRGEFRPLRPGASIAAAAASRPCDGCPATIRYRVPVQPGGAPPAPDSPPFRIFMSTE